MIYFLTFGGYAPDCCTQTENTAYKSEYLKRRNQKDITQNTMSHIGFRNFPSLADEIAEPHPDMNIKVAAFTVGEKSSNTIELPCTFVLLNK